MAIRPSQVYVLGYVQLYATAWTSALQAPLSTEFSRQEYWSGLPFPPPGDLPNQGSNQSILKEIGPEYSLERLMLKQKL